ncbi:conserved membrane hypothetical protein [Sphingomonas sp. EC-HK361]|uniref:O-antigen ligase family protein n=1 Tax=Sphingomonas sp. EC-HK361 TaxID=2038397 RepID=UPI00125B3252|nr:O-antigen ligase family protein [Sphingomonas sp. EC-HK361]VVT22639.1 conserved membrane hypothetical protein [Sphingomonas sp. EC-HK361]
MTSDVIEPVQPGWRATAPSLRVAMDEHAVAWGRIAKSCLFFAVFFSGWSLLRVGQINLTFSDIAFFACLGIVAVQGRLNLMPFGPLTPYWIAGLAMMLGGLFVSSIINGDPLRWANVASQYTVAYLFIPLLLMQQERRLTRILPMLFVLGTTLSEAIGIATTFVFTYHDTIGLLGDGFITGNDRLGAMAGQPNPNGAVVAFSLPMLIYTLNIKAMPRLLGLVCAVILLWGLMLSASFTGFFACIVAIGLTLTVLGFRHVVRLGLVMAVALGLFVASGAPLPKAFQTRVGSAVESGDINQAGTFVNRSELIAEAWTFAENTTVIGMGVDRYRELSQYDNPVHDLYLLIWNEGGAVAFVGLMTMLVLLVIMAIAGLKRSRPGGAMACAVVAVFLIYTASYPHMYSRMWVMPVMVALSVIYVRPEPARGVQDPIPPDPVAA